jgi:curved DNA-binding protein CbpA
VSATRVRDWTTIDYYALLGVEHDASDEDISQAFRSCAKRLHPDASNDPVASEQFKEVAAAYTVLSDRRRRRDYDRVRGAVVAPSTPRIAPSAATPSTVRPGWTRRRASIALVGGLLVTVLGLAATYFTWYLHDRDADRRARFVPVVAERVGNGDITFRTSDGRLVQAREPRQHGEGTRQGPTVAVRYDPSRPAHVIVDAGSFGRDITLAIVALKLLIGGPVFAVLGGRRLRRT